MRFSNAIKILTDAGTAIGVVYLRHGITQVSMCKREIIVTAGPLKTPVLLLRSGIGPSDALSQAELPIVHNLPGVGAFLQIHPYIALRFTHPIQEPNDQQLISFLSSHPGRRGATGSQELQAFIRTRVAPWRGSWPDMQIVHLTRARALI